MLELGTTIVREAMNLITILTIVIMAGGLIPKPWNKTRQARAARKLAERRRMYSDASR